MGRPRASGGRPGWPPPAGAVSALSARECPGPCAIAQFSAPRNNRGRAARRGTCKDADVATAVVVLVLDAPDTCGMHGSHSSRPDRGSSRHAAAQLSFVAWSLPGQSPTIRPPSMTPASATRNVSQRSSSNMLAATLAPGGITLSLEKRLAALAVWKGSGRVFTSYGGAIV